jgi:hypothetical protein
MPAGRELASGELVTLTEPSLGMFGAWLRAVS